MRVALIFCLFKHKKFKEDLKVVSDEFGRYTPLGLAYAAAILEKNGHEVILIDATALKLSKEETLNKIEKFNSSHYVERFYNVGDGSVYLLTCHGKKHRPELLRGLDFFVNDLYGAAIWITIKDPINDMCQELNEGVLR